MLNLEQLNKEQRHAVINFNGPMLILAGAGTGKTRVITYRVAHMLEKGIPASQIAALSFTNKAAREMAERVRDIGGSKAKDVWLGTFHSFCLHILRSFAKEAGLQHRFGLAGTSDQVDIVRKALEEKNWAGAYDAQDMLTHISKAKNCLLTPADLRKLDSSGNNIQLGDVSLLAEVYDLYDRQLRLNRVIDFDDCILKAVLLLRDNTDVRAKVREKIRYLLVDEFQDTNSAQLAMIQYLASDKHDVCVVGDDDQSIYSWRGAVYEILENFEALFPKTQLIKLEQNYRCPQVVLNAANGLIQNNKQRKDKTLWSAKKDEDPIIIASKADEREEADWVSEKMMALMGKGHKPQDMAILYRANAQARAFELALREARIPYRTFGGQSFFERKEVKDFLAYVRIILHPNDRLALWRIINTPNRGLGLKTLERIEALAQSRKRGPFQVIESHQYEGIGNKQQESLKNFAEMIHSLSKRSLSSPEDYEQMAADLLKLSHLENDIKQNSTEKSRDKKLENVRALPNWIKLVAQDLLAEKGRIDRSEILDLMNLDSDKRDTQNENGQYVSLMTVHAAKGLEFPAVFVVGCEEEQLPHKNSIHDNQALCEERRLFYVAVTRAKKHLYLTYCRQRSSGFSLSDRKPSRFLRELPEDTKHWQSSDDADILKSKQERKIGTLSALSKLKNGLRSGF